MPAILETQNLTTNYRTMRGWVRAAEGVNIRVEKGEALGHAPRRALEALARRVLAEVLQKLANDLLDRFQLVRH